MRISELSRASGVPIPTVKYYLREGLLPGGERTSANQATYSEAHLRRLRLIRVLVEVGGLSIAAVKDVLAALGDEHIGIHDLLGAVQSAMVSAQPREDADWRTAADDVEAYLADLGWRVRPDAPARVRLADVLHGLRSISGEKIPTEVFDPYARVAAQMGLEEIASLPDADAPREELVTSVTVGIAAFGAAFTALRLLAEEDASARRYGGD